MAEHYFIATIACVDALEHIEFLIEFFKLLKNGKGIKSKLSIFLDTIIDPSGVTDAEIIEFISMYNDNFFKNKFNLNMKQKVMGLYIRLNCSDYFCAEVVNSELNSFIITPPMQDLNNLLKKSYKPIIIQVDTSSRSNCHKQIKRFDNISIQQFDTMKFENLRLSRKMSHFKVFSVKKTEEELILSIISNYIGQHHQEIDTIIDQNINLNLSIDTDDIEEFLNGDKDNTDVYTIDGEINLRINLSEYFKNFSG